MNRTLLQCNDQKISDDGDGHLIQLSPRDDDHHRTFFSLPCHGFCFGHDDHDFYFFPSYHDDFLSLHCGLYGHDLYVHGVRHQNLDVDDVCRWSHLGHHDDHGFFAHDGHNLNHDDDDVCLHDLQVPCYDLDGHDHDDLLQSSDDLYVNPSSQRFDPGVFPQIYFLLLSRPYVSQLYHLLVSHDDRSFSPSDSSLILHHSFSSSFWVAQRRSQIQMMNQMNQKSCLQNQRSPTSQMNLKNLKMSPSYSVLPSARPAFLSFS
ncbi:hypothetical protein GCK72_005429 [Caenorhabditis remanei]|uniref:Uncharacterized protein n=1 Tax=Caenorhabditis remanei TaxID=31234 RepID=A0A6A5HED7_CAERE|nr:hypothetical protein GCK72_005429 [Caenorhabditis remanei]KAF1765477.1 hypothetical protein GCK72_005429 [Caenorhabditis remanei]